MKVVIVIGHTEDSPGAYGSKGVNEYSFNNGLASLIVAKLPEDMDVVKVYRRTYKELPGLVNSYNPDLVISLHANAFNGSVGGTETLYYHGSFEGKQCASILQDHCVDALQLKDRGIRAKKRIDRGGYLLQKTHAPCIILEPFFIDNEDDLIAATYNKDRLAEEIVKGIEEIFDVVV